jgi:LPXTG-motif cell wall-anchored protein
MRIPRLGGLLLSAAASVAVVVSAAIPGVAAASQPAAPSYYLSLGDSLAVGVQPDSHGQLHSGPGYADLLFAAQKATQPNLQLVKLGCSGETAQTMLNGGICHYNGSSSQLDAATRFLAAHRGATRLVTLDIGANDVASCVTANNMLDAACAEKAVQQVSKNLPVILSRLRSADPGVGVQWAGMTYYDPFLAAGLLGDQGRQEAAESLKLTDALNGVLAQEYHAAGFALAPVDQRFATHDTRQVNAPGLGTVPRNVATICMLTWACTTPPVGPDIHTNNAGYGTIASAFASVLRAPHRPSSTDPATRVTPATPASGNRAAAALSASSPATSGATAPAASLARTGTNSTQMLAFGTGAGALLALGGTAVYFGRRRRNAGPRKADA